MEQEVKYVTMNRDEDYKYARTTSIPFYPAPERLILEKIPVEEKTILELSHIKGNKNDTIDAYKSDPLRGTVMAVGSNNRMRLYPGDVIIYREGRYESIIVNEKTYLAGFISDVIGLL